MRSNPISAAFVILILIGLAPFALGGNVGANAKLAAKNGRAIVTADIHGEIRPEMIDDILNHVKLLKEPSVVELNLNSPGGYFEVSKILVKHIRAGRHKLVCIGDKFIASAAYYIFLHCDERYVTKGTTFAFHWIVTGYSENPPSDDFLTDLFWMAREQSRWDGVGMHVTGLGEDEYHMLRNRGAIDAEVLLLLSQKPWFKFISKEGE